MKSKKTQVFTLGLLLTATLSGQVKAMDWFTKEVSKDLGVQVTTKQVNTIAQNPTLIQKVIEGKQRACSA